MARRRRNDKDWIGVITSLAALIFLLGAISPVFQQVIYAMGIILMWILGLVIVGLVGFLIYRVAKQSKPGRDPQPLRSFDMTTLKAGEFLNEEPSAAPDYQRTTVKPAPPPPSIVRKGRIPRLICSNSSDQLTGFSSRRW